MPVKPITGMLRRGLVLDLSVAFGLGTSAGYLWWYVQSTFTHPQHLQKYSERTRKEKEHKRLTEVTNTGFHVPAVRRRDLFYAKLEDERAAALGQL
ncbi:hypothetical protein E4T50_04543 [Aureobasidium sp. EXF-12298]|nr:hypothetical protein E4T50_04543 [Aureobasidium sp. EXF-12298]KAI4766696.1 hypothetical protein E4T51_00403 [Aureobasidium sp. EXF-12344]KAI4784648.1 hypothetical protein E4T52_00475 [Aureobasidium sp. EXF-3400]